MATVAGLTPVVYVVDIWDEAILGELSSAVDLPRHYDIIGVGGYSADYERTVAIGRILRGLSVPIVVGGVGASIASDPGRYLGFLALYDLIFAILSWASFEYVVTE
jgi:hypothetical protein